MVKKIRNLDFMEKASNKLTGWIGTPQSVLVHTLLFVGIFGLSFFNLTLDKILLVLTTAVSLEAIYLAIFIQMTVNRNTQSLEEVEEDIEEIQEDVEELEKDVDEIQEDVEDIQEEDLKDDLDEEKRSVALQTIENGLQKLLNEIEVLKQKEQTHEKSLE